MSPGEFLSLECSKIRSFQLGEAVDLHEFKCGIKLYTRKCTRRVSAALSGRLTAGRARRGCNFVEFRV
jgi:hypothetical protein